MAEDEVKRMTVGKNLAEQLVFFQWTKSQEKASRTAHVLEKFRYNIRATKLRGWHDYIYTQQ